MRRVLKYTLLLLHSVLFGCNSDRVTTASLPPVDTSFLDTNIYAAGADSLRIPSSNIPAPEGFYQGMLPGGVQHTVFFGANHTYRLEEVEPAKRGAVPFSVAGTWRPTDSVIWLYKEGVVQGRYTWQGDTLMYLQAKKDKRYPLHKLTGALENDVWRAKGEAGTVFFGVGNEPFWNIEIHGQKGIAFHLAEWSSPIGFNPARPVAAGDSIVYNTANDSATLRVIIYNTFCSDGMSDFIYNNSVKAIYNGQTYRGCGIRY